MSVERSSKETLKKRVAEIIEETNAYPKETQKLLSFLPKGDSSNQWGI